MRLDGYVMAGFLALFVLSPAGSWAEHDRENIDKMMSSRQKEIALAFSDFNKTKSVSKLAEIEKLNEDAGSSLIQWWDAGHLPCCIDKDSGVKKDLEEDWNKFTSYLKQICANYTRIARYYASKNMKHKARTIYQYIMEAFDSPELDQCTGEARTRLESYGRIK